MTNANDALALDPELGALCHLLLARARDLPLLSTGPYRLPEQLCLRTLAFYLKAAWDAGPDRRDTAKQGILIATSARPSRA